MPSQCTQNRSSAEHIDDSFNFAESGAQYGPTQQQGVSMGQLSWL
eukprot:COSAG01_NODE_37129_length_508_cov_0.726161_1_plen_44_part_01